MDNEQLDRAIKKCTEKQGTCVKYSDHTGSYIYAIIRDILCDMKEPEEKVTNPIYATHYQDRIQKWNGSKDPIKEIYNRLSKDVEVPNDLYEEDIWDMWNAIKKYNEEG